ncbi:MAG: HDOD domain-containing protein [Syntrophobacteraceae bacterium]|nr:HDOD domain-containing protein [Desulfobacteraceae bacterium]
MASRDVPSGSYVVGKSQDTVLVAYLGTCVGVAMRDREAGVGGLIHFLLPEPTSTDMEWQPEINARTGLPLFIEALCREGARKERLEASIAGGALVGPVTEADLFLDIGGRTADVVTEILSRENIPILRSEVGGYFSCKLSLNLRTWKTSIDPIGISATPGQRNGFQKPRPGRLSEAVESIQPIPQVALKLIRMTRDQNYSMRDVSNLVAQDQVISAKVIRLCNSVLLHQKARIDSIDKALLRLGEKMLIEMAVATLVADFLSQAEQGYSLCKGGLFKHALGTARTAHELARLTDAAPPDLAYTAGLLHDIGKVALDQFMTEACPFFYRNAQETGDDLIQMERELFGMDHTQSGGMLSKRWNLPDSIDDVIRNHHYPEHASVNPELVHLVYLADLIMSRFMVGQEVEQMNTHHFNDRLKLLGLKAEHLPLILGLVWKLTLDGASKAEQFCSG